MRSRVKNLKMANNLMKDIDNTNMYSVQIFIVYKKNDQNIGD